MTDSSSDTPSSGRPKLLERLKLAFGLAPASLRDDLEDALEQSEGADSFSPHERAILRNVLELHEHRVHDIMVPRADIVAVAADASLADVLSLFRTAGHSRLPVHGETLDDPRGMVHIRDFVDYLARAIETAHARRRGPDGASEESLQGPAAQARRPSRLVALGAFDLNAPLSSAGVIRPVLFVPPSMPALDLLVRMQASRTHMALVIDEYGGTDGLVSIEDVVEMIVGDIEDEHDLDESPRIEQTGEREFLADARADLEAASDATGLALAEEAEAGDVDTLAGLVTLIAGRVPTRGEIIKAVHLPLEFEIIDADPRRIKRLRMRLTASQAGGASEPSLPGAI